MFEYFSPRSLATPQAVAEYLALHHVAQEFRLEVEYRDQFEAYCAWYYQVAQQNRQDNRRMQSELNVLEWFSHTVRPAR